MDSFTKDVKALTFDLFGTVLDLGGSLAPAIGAVLKKKGSPLTPDQFWGKWRARQRLEQYQDSMFMVGHSGYLATSRRALEYTLALEAIDSSTEEIDELMAAWQQLSPFPEVKEALPRLAGKFTLMALSNGDPAFLEHLAKSRIQWDFDYIFSVTKVGRFKPHPSVYRAAMKEMDLEPANCCMISSNSFDVLGARHCGFRAVYVNRSGLPYEPSPLKPDATVKDFTELADLLAG